MRMTAQMLLPMTAPESITLSDLACEMHLDATAKVVLQTMLQGEEVVVWQWFHYAAWPCQPRSEGVLGCSGCLQPCWE